MSQKLYSIAGALLCAASALAATQAPYVETDHPLGRTLLFSYDRTASASAGDLAQNDASVPELAFNNSFQIARSRGLFAGGQLTLQLLSYQMWLLDHPQVSHRKEIPDDTKTSSGELEVRFLNHGKLVSRASAVAKLDKGTYAHAYCRDCNDHRNPGYTLLETESLAIPLEATDIEVELRATVDLSTGKPITSSTLLAKKEVYYHLGQNPRRITALESIEPKNGEKPQFALPDPGKVLRGSSFVFEDESFINMRSHSLIWWDKAVEKAYTGIPVCYDAMNPSRVHYTEGNDVKIVNKTLLYRTGGTEWKRVAARDNAFAIPPIDGAQLEFAFEYELNLDLKSGLFDINRCYQLGADFKWVPSQPGVEEIPLGKFYDSPTGDASRGWKIELE